MNDYMGKYSLGYKLECIVCGKHGGIYGEEDVGTSWIRVDVVETYTPAQLQRPGYYREHHYTVPHCGDYCSTVCLLNHLEYFKNAYWDDAFKDNLSYYLEYGLKEGEVILGLEGANKVSKVEDNTKLLLVMGHTELDEHVGEEDDGFYRKIITRNNIRKVITTGLLKKVDIRHEDIGETWNYDFSEEELWDNQDDRWKIREITK